MNRAKYKVWFQISDTKNHIQSIYLALKELKSQGIDYSFDENFGKLELSAKNSTVKSGSLERIILNKFKEKGLNKIINPIDGYNKYFNEDVIDL